MSELRLATAGYSGSGTRAEPGFCGYGGSFDRREPDALFIFQLTCRESMIFSVRNRIIENGQFQSW